MHKVAEFIVGHSKLLLVVFGALTAVCGLLTLLVPINFNLADYVPDDSPSTVAMNVIAEEFDDSIPNARVYVPDLTLAEAVATRQQIEALPTVESVLWLDDFLDLKVPLELADPDLVSGFLTADGGALFQVSVDLADTTTTLAELQQIATPDGAVEGQLVDLALAQVSTSTEVNTIMLFMIPLGLLLLTLSTLSWLEPLILAGTIGVAIALNMGTNVFLDEISFITAAVAGVLQFAVSMDYGIFMLHARKRYLTAGVDRRESLVLAIVESSTAILVSSATTIFGFLALVFMSFQLGPDLGVVLAKGVGFSLLCVIFFMPALMLVLDRAVEATSHRSLLPSFRPLGRAVSRSAYWLLLIGLLLPVAFVAQGMNDFRYGTGAYPIGSREDADRDFIQAEFGRALPMALLVPRGQWGAEHQLETELAGLDRVVAVASYQTQVGRLLPAEVLPQDQLSSLLSENYSRIVLTVDTAKEGDEAFALVEQVRQVAQEHYPDSYHLTGESVVLYDMRTSITADNIVVNGLAIATVWLVLLVSFRSLLIPFLLVLTIEGAIWLNLAVPYFSGNYMVYIGYLIISTVQLGATVDYGILFTQHYLGNRGTMSKRESITKTVGETFGTLLTPALILASAGLILNLVSSLEVVSQLGAVLGRGALISFVMVNLFLPGLLLVFDRAIEKTTWKVRFTRSEQ
ncbi:MAG: MMPL family transporter [Brooklawnia sp.]|uniref:efflux RND transporter permease subunit n=1 Tax=Brooklawnia sp. TaxID=2699740 RepID=UPI003C7431AB